MAANISNLSLIFNSEKFKQDISQDAIKDIDRMSEDPIEKPKDINNDIDHLSKPDKINPSDQDEIKLVKESGPEENLGPEPDIDDQLSDPGDEAMSDLGDRHYKKADTLEYKKFLLRVIERYANITKMKIPPSLGYRSSLDDLELWKDRAEEEFNRSNRLRLYRYTIYGIAWVVEYICKLMGKVNAEGWCKHIQKTISEFDIYYDEMTKPITEKYTDPVTKQVKYKTVPNPSFFNKIQMSSGASITFALLGSFIGYYAANDIATFVEYASKIDDTKKEEPSVDFINNEEPVPESEPEKEEKIDIDLSKEPEELPDLI